MFNIDYIIFLLAATGWRENQWMKFWQSRTLSYPSSSNIFSLLNIIHFINHLNKLILYFVKMNCCLCYIFNKLTHLLLLGSFTTSLYNVNTIVRMLGVCIWEDFTTSCYMRISLWAWPFDTSIIFYYYYITVHLMSHSVLMSSVSCYKMIFLQLSGVIIIIFSLVFFGVVTDYLMC